MMRSRYSSWRPYNRAASSLKGNLSLCPEASTRRLAVIMLTETPMERAFCQHLIRYSGRITTKAPYLIISKPMSSSRVESPPSQSLNQLLKMITLKDPQKKKKTLNFINPEKFIVQNNFIPVPSILMNQTASGKLKHVGSGQAQMRTFIDSGENLTQERFTKSR